MALFIYVIIGLLLGYFASILTHNQQDRGTLFNVIAGFVGSLAGGWIAHIVISAGLRAITWQGMLFSILSGLIVITVMNLIWKKGYL
jgi:uncharacterized membrane protein YeaQ/YmgE (transglycosylase-associated protein family)